jgi:hypothetical protein
LHRHEHDDTYFRVSTDATDDDYTICLTTEFNRYLPTQLGSTRDEIWIAATEPKDPQTLEFAKGADLTTSQALQQQFTKTLVPIVLLETRSALNVVVDLIV